MLYQGKTVEEAVEAGLKELGLSAEDVEITVVDQGKRKLFGSIPAKVEIAVKEKPTDGARAVAFLEGLFPLLGADVKAELKEEEDRIVIELEGETAKTLIGRRGEIIDAVQTLAGAVANTGRKEYLRVVVDCGNYREDREETLKRLALKRAEKAVRLGKRIRLEPMNPYERRIIHSALVDNDEVTTKSEGKEPARYVVITPKNLRTEKKPERGQGRGRNERGGQGDRGRDHKYGDKKYGEKKYGDRKYGDKKPYPKRELPKEGTPESSGTSIGRTGTPGYKKGGFSGFFGTYLGKADDEPETTVTSETPSEGTSVSPAADPSTPDEA